MEIPLSTELQSKLARLAYQQGRESGELAVEAIERMVDYDEWFLAEVGKGLADVERGHTHSHDDVGARLDRYFAAKHQGA